MASKRYSVRSAENLLARLVAFAEGSTEVLVDQSARRLLRDVIQNGPVLVIGDAPIEITGTASRELTPWPASRYAQLQQRLRGFFGGLVDLASTDQGGLVPTVHVNRLIFGATPTASGVVVTVDGPAADVLLFQVVQLIQAVGVSRLRRCPNEKCRRIFAKTGRREFCSDRCQKRVYMRGLRKRERERLEKQRRSRYGKATRKR